MWSQNFHFLAPKHGHFWQKLPSEAQIWPSLLHNLFYDLITFLKKNMNSDYPSPSPKFNINLPISFIVEQYPNFKGLLPRIWQSFCHSYSIVWVWMTMEQTSRKLKRFLPDILLQARLTVSRGPQRGKPKTSCENTLHLSNIKWTKVCRSK